MRKDTRDGIRTYLRLQGALLGENASVYIVQLIAIPLLVAMNGLFVAAEFALVTSRRQRIKKLAERGNRRARTVMLAIDNQNDYIAATQLGITMASLALGWLGEPTIANLIEPLFAMVPGPMSAVAIHAVAFVIAFTMITAMHIILGELTPKSVALWHPERTALVTLPLVHIFLRTFRPFIAAMNASANLILVSFGLKAPVGHHVVTSEDFQLLAVESALTGAIGEEEAAILQRTFRFADKKAKDVMVPRIDVRSLPRTASIEQASTLFAESGFTRLPVYDNTPDNITGVIHSKDLIPYLIASRNDETIGPMLRGVMSVHENRDSAEMLEEMRQERTHVAAVVDEYGVTVGIITMEDLVEEVVGEITSEHQAEDSLITGHDGRTVIVDAAISIDDLNLTLGVELGDEEVNTLGGYVFREMGRVPKTGESFDRDNITFTIVSMERNRVGEVRLERAEDWPERRSGAANEQ